MGTTAEINRPLGHGLRFNPKYLWFALLALPVAGIMAFVVFQPIQVLPRISLAPGYHFVDADGHRLTNEDLRGKFVFYTFSHTGCDDDCPDTATAMLTMQQLAAGLDTGGVPVEFVTILFDAEQATPERMRAYAARAGADVQTWRFVTGDPARLKNVIGGGFSAYYEELEDGTYRFDPTFVLVDGWGIIRTRYRTATPDLEIVERDIGLLASELQNSEGASRIAYEAAHLFLCYPD